MKKLHFLLIEIGILLWIPIQGFAQIDVNDSSVVGSTIKLIHKNFGRIVIPDSATFFLSGYHHLKGKIGHSNATIELNDFSRRRMTAYVFSDSLQNINAFEVDYKKGVFNFSNSDWSFMSGNKTITTIILAIDENKSFVGYARDENTDSQVPCVFEENYSDSSIRMWRMNFSYENKYRNFPVSLSEDLLFADKLPAVGKSINSLLLNEYDLIGENYDDVMNKISFSKIAYLKNTSNYKNYSVTKFIQAYKNIITDEFLENAKESGHTDIFLNSLSTEVLWNCNNCLVLQLIMYYADGNSYPYYDTFIFEYDLRSKNIISPGLNTFSSDDENKVKAVIKNLQKNGSFDDSESGDEWFLKNSEIAFILKDGIVLYKRGGNHGIHFFYKYYPLEMIAPLLNKN